MSAVAADRSAGTRHLPDIQLLRAVAVAMVVLFHLWPAAVPGGFAGVDVFFVISGYLITAHLLREAVATGGIALRHFWARRIARLLPSALLVLAVTLLAAWLWLPPTQWRQTALEAAASALYFENWVLAAAAVDYFAASKAATALQHYWSLSVEEQFYLAWPLLVLAGLRVARARGCDPVAATTTLLAVVCGTSLLWSLHAATGTDPGYFSTFVRAWEFAAGGLLAASSARASSVRLVPAAAATLRWGGLAALVVTAFGLHGGMAFPGVVALLPVCATLAVIAVAAYAPAAASAPGWPLRAVHRLGDLAYPVYLWHWPLVVIAPYALQTPPGDGQRVLLAATLLLAWLTSVTLEHRFRPWAARSRRVWPVYVAALGASLLLLAGCLALYRAGTYRAPPTTAAAAADSCTGAAAMRAGASCPDRHRAPPPGAGMAAQADGGALWLYNRAQADPYYQRTCTWHDEAQRCAFPRFGGDALEVLLVGDSHMLQYVPAVAMLARANRWNLRYALSLGCPAAHLTLGTEDGTRPTDVCRRWRATVPRAVAAERADLIVAISSTRRYARGTSPQLVATLSQAFEATWRHWRDSGKQVLVVVDNPLAWNAAGQPVHIPDCVAAAPGVDDPCVQPRARAMAADPVDLALARAPGIARFDPTWAFCDADDCHFAVGGEVTHLDPDHVTATFNLGLMPELGAAILAAANRDPATLVVPPVGP